MEPRKDQVGTIWRGAESHIALTAFDTAVQDEAHRDRLFETSLAPNSGEPSEISLLSEELALPPRPVVKEDVLNADSQQTLTILRGLDLLREHAQLEVEGIQSEARRLHRIGQRLLRRSTSEERGAIAPQFRFATEKRDGIEKTLRQTKDAYTASIKNAKLV